MRSTVRLLATLLYTGYLVHVGLLMVDFVRDTVGLHVNGRAEIASTEAMARSGALRSWDTT